jgi:hypothetical protein
MQVIFVWTTYGTVLMLMYYENTVYWRYILCKFKYSNILQSKVRLYAKFVVLTAVLLKIQFLLDITPCRPVNGRRRSVWPWKWWNLKHFSLFTKVISRRWLILQFSNTYLLQNVRTNAFCYTTSQLRRPTFDNIRRENLKSYVII